jgi:hypothetical protein
VLAWSFVAVLLVSGIPFMFAPAYPAYGPGQSSIAESEAVPDFNIYHIVFDGYYGPWLQWSLAELGRDTSELAGFTHYRRNVSNYWSTQVSYPSFMSGTMYSPDITVTEWYKNADEDSIIADLHEQGFSTSFYGFRLYYGIKQVEVAYRDDPGGLEVVGIGLAADYCLLRVAPVVLRHLVLDERGAGPITRRAGGSEENPGGDIRTLISYRQFQKFLADEWFRPAGGHYVHAHFYPPHEPNQLDRYGNYVGESSYEEQVLLATNMLLDMVATLKEQGKFEDSLIIVHSDHGSVAGAENHYVGDPMRDFMQMDEATAEAIREVSVRQMSGGTIEARYQAFLLIKPPGSCEDAEDLTVNDGLTQLLDLRQYIGRVIDEGDCAYPEREQVDIQHGLHFQAPYGERLTVGIDIMSGYINHYIIRPGGEWEICDNIPFEYK